MSNPRIFLVRHGHVDKAKRQFDSLNNEGSKFSNALPTLLARESITPIAKFFDVGDGDTAPLNRCRDTLARVDTQVSMAYGSREVLRNIGAVFKEISLGIVGDCIVCYRSESIESGDLYFVENLDLHTNFYRTDYSERVRTIMKSGYRYIYQLEMGKNSRWKQTQLISIPENLLAND